MGIYVANLGSVWKNAVLARMQVPDATAEWFLRRLTQHVVDHARRSLHALTAGMSEEDLTRHLEKVATVDEPAGGRLDSAWGWVESGGIYVRDYRCGVCPEFRAFTEADVRLFTAAREKDKADVAAAQKADERSMVIRPQVLHNGNIMIVTQWLKHIDECDPKMLGKLGRLKWMQAVQHSHKWTRAVERQAESKARAEARRAGADDVEFVMDVEDGHRWVRLRSPAAILYEGNCMSNCLRHADEDYYRWSEIYSLRNAENVARVTVEVEADDYTDSGVCINQIQGWANEAPALRYRLALKALVEMLKPTYVRDVGVLDATYRDGKLLFIGTLEYDEAMKAARALPEAPLPPARFFLGIPEFLGFAEPRTINGRQTTTEYDLIRHVLESTPNVGDMFVARVPQDPDFHERARKAMEAHIARSLDGPGVWGDVSARNVTVQATVTRTEGGDGYSGIGRMTGYDNAAQAPMGLFNLATGQQDGPLSLRTLEAFAKSLADILTTNVVRADEVGRLQLHRVGP
jgi:hypothetical protein